jgi:2-oxoglutarate/2-oxoacid ferredoxin oxidoreductase subunit beta
MGERSFLTYETAWCPGCGNFVILECLKTALERMGKKPSEVLVAAGIGQAAKTPQYIGANAFCGLHGRALPAAVAAKIANEGLTVIVDTGDGDSYGEGGNHFIHNIRRNVDIAHFVHDNQVYGLTKGQASPTSDLGMVTGVQTDGNINEPLNPVLLAIACGAGFVARGFTGQKEQLVSLMMQAIDYQGYALVDILQPCVSFNKTNTFGWYKERVYDLDESHDSGDKAIAMAKAMEFIERIPLGVLYREEKRPFHRKNEVLQSGAPLIERKTAPEFLDRLIKSYQ